MFLLEVLVPDYLLIISFLGLEAETITVVFKYTQILLRNLYCKDLTQTVSKT